MITINRYTGKGQYKKKPDIKLNYERDALLIWGSPLLWDDQPFHNELIKDCIHGGLEKVVPRLSGGGYFCIWENNGVVKEFAVDYYGHTRVYYTWDEENIYISSSWYLLPHETEIRLDLFSIIYFLNWNHTFLGGTFFENLRSFAPSYCYQLENGRLGCEYMSMPEYGKGRVFDAMVKVLHALAAQMEMQKVGVMLSGGIDSAQILLAAQRAGFLCRYMNAHIQDIQLYDNLVDEYASKDFLKREGLDGDNVQVYIEKFLDGWKNQLPLRLPFEYKDGRLWQGIASAGKKLGCQLIVSGQNADALYNYSYTTKLPLTQFFREVYNMRKSGKAMIESSKIKDYYYRFLTTDRFLHKIFIRRQEAGYIAKKIWKIFNGNASFSRSAFLAWVAVKGNGYHDYHGIIASEALTEGGKNYYEKMLKKIMDKMIGLLDSGQIRNPRELLLETKLVGYIAGEDNRCICEACRLNDINSLQIYNTAPVFGKLKNVKIDFRDCIVPKRHSYKKVMKNSSFKAAQKDVRNNVKREGTYTASEVWNVIYDILNKKYDMENKILQTINELNKTKYFVDGELLKIAERDIGVKMRLAWMGIIFDIWKNPSDASDMF